MANLTIDGVEYERADLSEEALAQLQSIEFADAEIARHQALVAALQTARNAYANALTQLLPDQS
ncbi:MAG: DUF6447 family protein [Halioglobus sp.]|nr:DUF6447 family protein [Halioglobus sp.]